MILVDKLEYWTSKQLFHTFANSGGNLSMPRSVKLSAPVFSAVSKCFFKLPAALPIFQILFINLKTKNIFYHRITILQIYEQVITFSKNSRINKIIHKSNEFKKAQTFQTHVWLRIRTFSNNAFYDYYLNLFSAAQLYKSINIVCSCKVIFRATLHLSIHKKVTFKLLELDTNTNIGTGYKY